MLFLDYEYNIKDNNKIVYMKNIKDAKSCPSILLPDLSLDIPG